MKITYYTHKPEEHKSRNISIGQKVVGVRLLSLEITNQQELHQLLKQFSKGEDLPSQPNLTDNKIAHFKNPGLIDFWKARLRGLKI